MKLATTTAMALILSGCFGGDGAVRPCAQAQALVDLTCNVIIPSVPLILDPEAGDFEGVSSFDNFGKPGDCVTIEENGKVPVEKCVPE